MFKSIFRELRTVTLPEFSGTRVLMLPFQMEDLESVPDDLSHYKDTIAELIAVSPEQEGVAYLTIDEKVVEKGETLRLKGLHVDGVGTDDRNDLSIWARTGLKGYMKNMWDEDKKEWCQRDTKEKWYNSPAAGIGGMITVSSPTGCRAWNKDFEGKIKYNGDCEHLREELFPIEESTVFESGMAYWCNSFCVHESMSMPETTKRTFVRLSMPSDAPWFDGYTKNPKGIKPTGTISHFHRSPEPEVVLNG